MTDKNQPPVPQHAGSTDTSPEMNRRRMLLRGGAVAGGLAAFAAGYGETVVVEDLSYAPLVIPTEIVRADDLDDLDVDRNASRSASGDGVQGVTA